MIRYFSSILLAMSVLFSNSGLVLVIHYCKENFRSASLAFVVEVKQEIPNNSCCSSEYEHKKCCDDKSIKTSDTDTNVLVKVLDLDDATALYLNSKPFSSFAFVTSKPKLFVSSYSKAHAPPLYKLYCRWVLYA